MRDATPPPHDDAVWITGLGGVTPLGDTPAAIFDAVCAPRPAVRPVFPELPTPAAAACAAFDALRWFTKLQLAGVDRVSQLAVAAAQLALDDAALVLGDAPDAPPPTRRGLYVGCGMGGAQSLDFAYQTSARTGKVPPLTVPAFMPNAPAAQVAMRQRIHGPSMTYSVACASSSVAIGEALKALRRGEVDVALAGGSEALIVPGVVAAWQAMHTLAPPGDDPARACRPFDAARSGFVLGEGAAFLVLERAASARARGARAWGQLAGAGLSCDATHLTKPDVDGQVRAVSAALADARLAPSDVGYVNAHGTATRIGDEVEAQTLRRVFGDGAAAAPWVGSTKAVHGHLLGAAGALEALVTALALAERCAPPTANLDTPDAACASLRLHRGRGAAPLDAGACAALSHSFAFGGTNSVLALRAVAPEAARTLRG